MRCVLIYNPAAGHARGAGAELIRKIAGRLAGLGHEVAVEATTGPHSATQRARNAVENGADVVFACGGDGTVHEALQGIVSEKNGPRCALGVIPLGSANALARHLRLPRDPVRAAEVQMAGQRRTISAGKIECGGIARYFTVMAGAGPDGELVYDSLSRRKSRFGRFAYYLRAAELFATRRFRAFEVAYWTAGSAEERRARAMSAMAVRVDNLGGLFTGLTSRKASVHQPGMHLALVRPPAILTLPLWFVSSWLRLERWNPFVTFADVSRFTIQPIAESGAHVQADGEWIGRIPASVSLVPNALCILVP